MVFQRLARANIALTEKMLAGRAQFVADMRPPMPAEMTKGISGLVGAFKTGMMTDDDVT